MIGLGPFEDGIVLECLLFHRFLPVNSIHVFNADRIDSSRVQTMWHDACTAHRSIRNAFQLLKKGSVTQTGQGNFPQQCPEFPHQSHMQ